jgi:hypothetical protein
MQHTAKGLAALGRNGDSMLLHVNPTEVAALSKVLGPLTTNPKTGISEAYGWGNIAGSILGGIGSFGAGAMMTPMLSEIAPEGLMGDLVKKAVPALTGAAINTAVGVAAGGKNAALGSAVQGLGSGFLGSMAGEDLMGKPYQPKFEKSMSVTDMKMPSESGFQPQAPKTGFGYDPTAQLRDPTESVGRAIDKSIDSSGGAQYSAGDIASKMMSSEGFHKMEDYMSPLFTMGMLGSTITAGKEQQDIAKQEEKQAAGYSLLQQLEADRLARQTYGPARFNNMGGYAAGGPITIQGQGPLPVSVTIPGPMADKVTQAGGLSNYIDSQARGLASFANGGYVNTQPFNPQQFYPQSRISSAQPYGAAAPTSVINTIHQGASFADGGLIEGEGDGMSDDIDANIDGLEDVRVADGEYLVPSDIAQMIGADRLDELLRAVRKAAHGKEEQVREGAGYAAAGRVLGV